MARRFRATLAPGGVPDVMDPRLERRQFLRITVGSILILPVGRFLVACGAEAEDPQTPSDNAAAPPRADGSSIVFSSSSNEAHFHTFVLEMALMATPPAGGVSGDTASVGGHSHSLSVSMEQLASAAAGTAVKVTTSNSTGHTHVVTFIKLTPGGGGEDHPDAAPYDPNDDPGDPGPY